MTINLERKHTPNEIFCIFKDMPERIKPPDDNKYPPKAFIAATILFAAIKRFPNPYEKPDK